MFSTKNGFASIVIVIASLFGAQSICADYFFPQPAFEDPIGSNEPEVSMQQRNFDDANDFPVWVGIEQGLTEDGFPILGSADAPIIILEFGDFACPHCLDFLPTVQSITDDYVRDDQAQLIFVPLTFVAGENSENAAEAALCAADQGAFWQFHQVNFEIQESQGTHLFTPDHLATTAESIGLDGPSLQDCMQSARPGIVLRGATVLQETLEVRGTPSVFYSLDGGETWVPLPDRSYSSISAVIESANAE